ncbi:anaphase-promoting complex subunit 15B [Pieris rapae]|uniref:anaphase-promoting complex subunit 15B n=1 Tax=Pieris rapae TaxID=64459 RepID=UPI000B926178|nr:anaphase-promoting complex subunit 15B [Pieris rapae]
MDLPFPVLRPHFTFPEWFNADNPCDEDAELTKLEQAHQRSLNSYTKRCVKHAPVQKPESEPVEEVETEYEGGNEDAEESEDSHDVDEDEQITTADSPEFTIADQEQIIHDDDFIPDVEVIEGNLWPYNIPEQ